MARYGLRPGLVAAGSLVAILVGVLVGWAWQAWISPPPDKGRQAPAALQAASGQAAQPPPYEEPIPHLPSSSLLQTIDEAVFAALQQHGVKTSDLTIGVVNTPESELTRIAARLKDGQKPRALIAAVQKKLGALVETKQVSLDRGLRLEISVGGLPTHQLDLVPAPLKPPPPPTPPQPPLPARPRVALVIDDLGYLMDPARKLIDLGLNLTLSILPHSPHGPRIERMAAKKGLEVMVHLPMEPRTYPKLKPGPGGLLVKMSPQQLREQTKRNLASVPSARGANNHMGSRFTENPAALKPVMKVLKDNGFFFLDSMTTPRSRAMEAARAQGLASDRRNIFLDHDPAPEAIKAQFKRMLRLAHQNGRVIAIAHPHRSTLAVLKAYAKRLKTEVRLVPVSELLAVQARPGTRRARRKGSPKPVGQALDSGPTKP